jgi:hypothetical protein
MGEFSESLLRTVLYDLETWGIIKGRVLPVVCSHYLNRGRNQLTQRYCDELAAHAEVFVSLDTDQVWVPPQVMHLVSLVDPVHSPIVSGTYWACDELGEQIRPVVLKRNSDATTSSVWDLPENTLMECDVVGMGFCAIHRDVLMNMRKVYGNRWYDFDETNAGKFMIEDDAFCARAQAMGYKIHVHTGIDVGHIKPCELRAKHARKKEATQEGLKILRLN